MALNMQLVRNRRRQIQKQEEERKQGKHFDTLQKGPNYRRVLPPWEGAEDWRKYAAYHFNVLEKEAVLCPKKTFNKPCPICEYNEELYASNDQTDKDEAKKIRAKDRFFCNVLNLDKKDDAKVYILGFGQTIEEQIIAIMDPGGKEGEEAEQFGYGDITDPMGGRTLLITKTVPADPTQTSYEVKAATTTSKIPNWEEISKGIHNLDAFIAADEYTYEELKGMLDGTFSGRNTSDSGSNPAPTGSTNPAKEDFGGAPKKEEKVQTASEQFEQPKGMTPPKTETVKDTQPAGTMSAIDRLKARKAQGK